jgi:hypothetical protein
VVDSKKEGVGWDESGQRDDIMVAPAVNKQATKGGDRGHGSILPECSQESLKNETRREKEEVWRGVHGRRTRPTASGLAQGLAVLKKE